MRFLGVQTEGCRYRVGPFGEGGGGKFRECQHTLKHGVSLAHAPCLSMRQCSVQGASARQCDIRGILGIFFTCSKVLFPHTCHGP